MPTTVALTAVADTYVNAINDNNFGNDGFISVGADVGSAEVRALLRFDLSGIPAGATVTDAYLELTTSNIGSTGPDTAITSIDAAWVETTVTWSTRPAQGNAGQFALKANEVYSGVQRKRWSGLTTLVQSWVSGTRANNGLSWYWTGGGAATIASARSRSDVDPTYRPILTVVYNRAPAQPGAFTSPTSGQVVGDSITVAWGAASDPDGDALVYDLWFTRDNGATWTQLVDNGAGTSYVHNTSAVAASTACFYQVTAYDTTGAASPVRQSPTFTIEHNVAPTAPTLTYPTGNVVLDRTVTNRFSWTFNDPNAGDSQSKYDLQYRISAGAWVPVTTVTPNTFHDFAAATFAAGDYEWQVRTYDNGGLVSPWSASQFFKAADPPGPPSITSPVNGSTIGTSSGVIGWSTPSQQAFQVRKVADNAGAANTATVYYDSGVVELASARNHGLTYPVNNRYEHLQIRRRDGGLWSSWSSVRVLVSYTPPAVPTLVAAGDAVAASIGLLITHPTPTGTQPTVTSIDVHRRVGGAGDGIRVAAAVTGTAWTDHTPASGVDYQYRVVAHGANGVDSTSAWTG